MQNVEKFEGTVSSLKVGRCQSPFYFMYQVVELRTFSSIFYLRMNHNENH